MPKTKKSAKNHPRFLPYTDIYHDCGKCERSQIVKKYADPEYFGTPESRKADTNKLYTSIRDDGMSNDEELNAIEHLAYLLCCRGQELEGTTCPCAGRQSDLHKDPYDEPARPVCDLT